MRVVIKNGPARTYDVTNIRRIDYQEAGFMQVLLLSGTVERFNLSEINSIQYQMPTAVKPVEIQTSEVKIYPNPASGMLTAEISGIQQPYQVSIYQISGQMMYSIEVNDDIWRLDVPLNWQNGTYVFRAFNSNQEVSRLFLIHR